MNRREFLLAAGGLASGLGVVGGDAHATPETMREALRAITGSAPLREGKVAVDVPQLVENGNVVPMTVKVDSPMTPAEHVRAIHVLAEKNPLPNVATFRLGPRSGRATVSARIRLADSQTVLAVAEMSDGSFWSGTASVIVTVAACLEET